MCAKFCGGCGSRCGAEKDLCMHEPGGIKHGADRRTVEIFGTGGSGIGIIFSSPSKIEVHRNKVRQIEGHPLGVSKRRSGKKWPPNQMCLEKWGQQPVPE